MSEFFGFITGMLNNSIRDLGSGGSRENPTNLVPRRVLQL